MHLLFSGRH